MKTKEKIIRYSAHIILLTGLAVCIAILLPQVRQMIIEFVEQKMLHRKTSLFEDWFQVLLSYAIGGILFIIFLGYCLLTASGKTLVHKVKNEILDSLAEIDLNTLTKPILIMTGIYLLG